MAADGTLIFNMKAEEELDPQYRTITAVVRIEGDTEKPVLEGISIVSGPDKTDYVQGEELDLKGLAVEAQYSDGSSVALEEGEDGYTVTGYDPQAAGEQTITVSYQEYTATFTVTVTEKEEPEDPDHPGQPENPGDPGQTEDPADPGQTEDPADPGQTEDPAKPGQTEDPADPGQTTDPGTPGSSAEPGGSSQTQGGSAVQTGDTANMAPAVLTAGLAAAAAAAVIRLRRRYR